MSSSRNQELRLGEKADLGAKFGECGVGISGIGTLGRIESRENGTASSASTEYNE